MNQILAALIFFTRLPFWKIKEVPQECFKHVVSYWSFSGWLTGGMMALIFWGASTILPHGVAVILALTSRLLITGALHEDGLADFFDGFGGGTNRESTLRIMKDSHIGSYGVLGLIIYYLLAYNLLVALPLTVTPFLLLSGAPAICNRRIHRNVDKTGLLLPVSIGGTSPLPLLRNDAFFS